MEKPQNPIPITKLHLKHCYTSLNSHILNLPLPAYPPSLPSPSTPLFVTWLKTKKKTLRGCIGTFQSLPLSSQLQKFALISAEDDRFGKIQKEEISDLHLSLSFLYDLEKIEKWQDWEIGVHGVYVEFWDHIDQCFRSATYLPEVMVINGWDREQAFRRCLRKSGFKGGFMGFELFRKELQRGIFVMRYKSSKGYMSYNEFVSMDN